MASEAITIEADMAGPPNTDKIAKLEEFRDNYKLFVQCATGIGIVWLGTLTALIYGVKGDIRAINQKISDGGLGAIVSSIEHPASQAQLAANLSVVASQIRAARTDNKPPNAENLIQLSTAVRQAAYGNPGLPDVWQAAFQLVSYRSEENRIPSDTALPDCLNVAGKALDQFRNTPYDPADPKNGMYAYNVGRCAINLDRAANYDQTIAAEFFREVFAKYPYAKKFINLHDAVITYSGGTMIPIDGMTFSNCKFVFTPNFASPPNNGQSLTEQLLASDLVSAEINLPPAA